MKALDYAIDKDDLKCLFLHTNNKVITGGMFEKWILETKKSYLEYHERNLNNLAKYGFPKTFSQWVNGQIIALT